MPSPVPLRSKAVEFDCTPEFGSTYFNTKYIIQLNKTDNETRVTIHCLKQGFWDWISDIFKSIIGTQKYDGEFDTDKAQDVSVSGKLDSKNFKDIFKDKKVSKLSDINTLIKPFILIPVAEAPIAQQGAAAAASAVGSQVLHIANSEVPPADVTKTPIDILKELMGSKIKQCQVNIQDYKTQVTELESQYGTLYESWLSWETLGSAYAEKMPKKTPLGNFIHTCEQEIRTFSQEGYKGWWSWTKIDISDMDEEVLAWHLHTIDKTNERIKKKILSLNHFKEQREVIRKRIDKEIDDFGVLIQDYTDWVYEVQTKYNVVCLDTMKVVGESSYLETLEAGCRNRLPLLHKPEPLLSFLDKQKSFLDALKDHARLDLSALAKQHLLVRSAISKVEKTLKMEVSTDYDFVDNQLAERAGARRFDELDQYKGVQRQIEELEGIIGARIRVLKDNKETYLAAYKLEKTFRSFNLQELQKQYSNQTINELLAQHLYRLQSLDNSYSGDVKAELLGQILELPGDHVSQEELKDAFLGEMKAATTAFVAKMDGDILQMTGHPLHATAVSYLTVVKGVIEKMEQATDQMFPKVVPQNRPADVDESKQGDPAPAEPVQAPKAFEMNPAMKYLLRTYKETFEKVSAEYIEKIKYIANLQIKEAAANQLLDEQIRAVEAKIANPSDGQKGELIEQDQLLRAHQLQKKLKEISQKRKFHSEDETSYFGCIDRCLARGPVKQTIRRTDKLGTLTASLKSSLNIALTSPKQSIATQYQATDSESLRVSLKKLYQERLPLRIHQSQEAIDEKSKEVKALLHAHHDESKDYLADLLNSGIGTSYNTRENQPTSVALDFKRNSDVLLSRMNCKKFFCFGFRKYLTPKPLGALKPAELMEHEQAVEALVKESDAVVKNYDKFIGFHARIKQEIQELRGSNQYLAAYEMEKKFNTIIYGGSTHLLNRGWAFAKGAIAGSGDHTLSLENHDLDLAIKAMEQLISAPKLPAVPYIMQLTVILKMSDYPKNAAHFKGDIAALEGLIKGQLRERVTRCKDELDAKKQKLQGMFGISDADKELVAQDIEDIKRSIEVFEKQFIAPRWGYGLLKSLLPKSWADMWTKWQDYDAISANGLVAVDPYSVIDDLCLEKLNGLGFTRLIETYDKYQAYEGQIADKLREIVNPAGHAAQFFYEQVFNVEVVKAQAFVSAWKNPKYDYLRAQYVHPKLDKQAYTFTRDLERACAKFDDIFKRTWAPLSVYQQIQKMNQQGFSLAGVDQSVNAHVINGMTQDVAKEKAKIGEYVQFLGTLQREMNIPVDWIQPVIDDLKRLEGKLDSEALKLPAQQGKSLPELVALGKTVEEKLLEVRSAEAKYLLERLSAGFKQFQELIAKDRANGKSSDRINRILHGGNAAIGALTPVRLAIQGALLGNNLTGVMGSLVSVLDTTNRQAQVGPVQAVPAANPTPTMESLKESLGKYEKMLNTSRESLTGLGVIVAKLGVDLNNWCLAVELKIRDKQLVLGSLSAEVAMPEVHVSAAQMTTLSAKVKKLTETVGQGDKKCYSFEKHVPVVALKTALDKFQEQQEKAKGTENVDVESIRSTQEKLVKRALANLFRPSDATECLHIINKATYLIKSACEASDKGNAVVKDDPWINAFNPAVGAQLAAGDMQKILNGFTTKLGTDVNFNKFEGINTNMDKVIEWYLFNMDRPNYPAFVVLVAAAALAQAQAEEGVAQAALGAATAAQAAANLAVGGAGAGAPNNAALAAFAVAQQARQVAAEAAMKANAKTVAANAAHVAAQAAQAAPAALPGAPVIPAVANTVDLVTKYNALRALKNAAAPRTLDEVLAYQKDVQSACSDMLAEMRKFWKANPIAPGPGVIQVSTPPVVRWW